MLWLLRHAGGFFQLVSKLRGPLEGFVRRDPNLQYATTIDGILRRRYGSGKKRLRKQKKKSRGDDSYVSSYVNQP